MKIKKTTFFSSIIIFLVFLLTACMSSQIGSSEKEALEPIPIKAVMLPFLGFAPFFIAEEEGYFVEEGLDVEYVDMSRGMETIPALLQGDLDVAGSALNFSVLNAIHRGGQLKIVGSTVQLANDKCTYAALLTSKAMAELGELESAPGWRDRRFATNPTGVEGYYIDAYLNEFGLSIDDVEIEDIPPPVLAEALQSGAMDFVHASEPWLTRIQEMNGSEIWVAAKDVVPDFQYAVLLYGPTLLEENPDGGERFMRAYLKAVEQLNEGKTDRNIEILAKYTELDPELLRQACWPPVRDDGQINVQSVLQFQDWGLQRGLLDGMVPEEDFWDSRFVDNVN